jgi:hypothetical protein
VKLPTTLIKGKKMKNLDLNNQQPFNSGEWFLDSIPVAKPPKNPAQVSAALQMRILCLTTATHRTAITM